MSTSSNSTSVSEFVRRRFRGDVSVFGGNPMVGARELGGALRSTFRSQQDLLASSMISMARSMDRLASTMTSDTASSPGVPISLISDDNPALLAGAANIDDDKLRMLLSASAVAPHEIAQYMSLLSTAREGLRRKMAAQNLQVTRKKAQVSATPSFTVADVELTSDLNASIDVVAKIIGIEIYSDDFRKQVALALTHESAVGGRDAARRLAIVGDAVGRLMLMQDCYRQAVSLRDANDLFQTFQNNRILSNRGEELGIHEHIVCSPDTDPKASKILASAIEALLGAVYLQMGFDGVRVVNRVLRVLPNNDVSSDGSEHTEFGIPPDGDVV